MEKLHQVPEALEVAQFAGVDRPLQCALLLAVLLLELRQLERSRGDADLEGILVPVRVVSQGFHLLDALERRDALLLQTNFDPVQHPLHRVETLEEGSDPLVERPEEATDEGQAFQKPPHPDRHRGLRPALLQVAAPHAGRRAPRRTRVWNLLEYARRNPTMPTVEKTPAIDPEVLADLEAVCNTKGIVRDPKLLRRITERADQVRQETLKKH